VTHFVSTSLFNNHPRWMTQSSSHGPMSNVWRRTTRGPNRRRAGWVAWAPGLHRRQASHRQLRRLPSPSHHPPVKRLTVAEIAERRKDGRCFHCDEPFTNGHKMVCKQLFTIELIHDDEPLAAGDELDPTISIHALAGIEPRSGRTMKVKVIINAVALTALLDSGSTHNFVDTDATTRAGLQLTPRGDLRVAVANGDRVSSPGSCCNISISIGGEVFSIDCYGLTLGAYDMVLGVQ
jgi:hypothetical protein